MIFDENFEGKIGYVKIYILVYIFRSPVASDDCSVLTASTAKMLNMLTEENKKLREELNNYFRTVSKLQKVRISLG